MTCRWISTNGARVMKSEHTRAWLALVVIALIALLVAGLFFIQIPAENKDLVNIALGFIAGYAASVVGYYFGDSDASRHKTELLSQSEGPSGNPGDPIHVENEDKP